MRRLSGERQTLPAAAGCAQSGVEPVYTTTRIRKPPEQTATAPSAPRSCGEDRSGPRTGSAGVQTGVQTKKNLAKTPMRLLRQRHPRGGTARRKTDADARESTPARRSPALDGWSISIPPNAEVVAESPGFYYAGRSDQRRIARSLVENRNCGRTRNSITFAECSGPAPDMLPCWRVRRGWRAVCRRFFICLERKVLFGARWRSARLPIQFLRLSRRRRTDSSRRIKRQEQ